MGSLTTLPALAVVFAHSFGFVFTGGQIAVQLFYMISGYLMSLILVEGEQYKSNADFWLNRLLRLFPIYWAVAATTLVLYLSSDIQQAIDFFDVYKTVLATASVVLIVSNLFLVGQDMIMFLGVSGSELAFTSDFTKSEVLLYKGLLVQPAWTLGVEI